jgi:uncharacterized membrane protein YtjA (UPF0391 family)
MLNYELICLVVALITVVGGIAGGQQGPAV